jgi:hypothetical protein
MTDNVKNKFIKKTNDFKLYQMIATYFMQNRDLIDPQHHKITDSTVIEAWNELKFREIKKQKPVSVSAKTTNPIDDINSLPNYLKPYEQNN